MEHLIFFLFTVVCAGLFACVEIQIEGVDGWGEKFPTWRIDTKWSRIFMSGKPLTGYHFYLLIFSLVVVHLPFASGLVPWTWQAEARVGSFLILFWVLEDFLWFVFNPAFGFRRFRKQYIWWHAPAWWWIAPKDYWLFSPIGLSLYWMSIR